MKIHKALWFGLSCLGLVILMIAFLTPGGQPHHRAHRLSLMLALIVVAIMLGFPTAFTLMGMGVLFTFLAYYMQSSDPGRSIGQTLDLMVQRTYATMTNDSLISIPLFVFMGYLVERANLIEKLFRSMHLALARRARGAGRPRWRPARSSPPPRASSAPWLRSWACWPCRPC